MSQTIEEKRAKNKAARLRWEAANPEKVKARYKRRVRKPAPKKEGDKPTHRVCKTCGVEKELATEYDAHGYGYRYECKLCRPKPKTLAERQRNYEKKNWEKVKAYKRENGKKHRELKALTRTVIKEQKPKAEKVKPAAVKKNQSLKDNGWRLVFCYGDQYEICRVYMKGPIIRFVSAPSHRSYGDYTVGKSSYGIALDDSGKRYQKLEQVERAL